LKGIAEQIMIAKPNRPILYLSIPLMLLYFMVTFLYQGINMVDILMLSKALFLGLFVLFSLKILNTKFQIFELDESLIIKGYFWGRREINLQDIKGYQTREVRRRGILFPEEDIIILDNGTKELCRLVCFEYDAKIVSLFKEKLNEKNIEYLGHESLKNQFDGLIKKVKSSIGSK
jgi:hypothetical protein